MAKRVFSHICLLLVLATVDACFIPRFLDVKVPKRLPHGYQIRTVEVADCDPQSLQLISSDPDFTIERGVLVTMNKVYVRPGQTFSVTAQDSSGSQSVMQVVFHPEPKRNENLLRRVKRRWSPPPFNIRENDHGIFPKDIERIVSDASGKFPVYYTLDGPGYNQDPVGVFDFDRMSAMLSITKPVDREQHPMFVLTVNVYNLHTGELADLPLDIKIMVDDVNDNHPQFSGPLQFLVFEQSSSGTVVGKVNATDRDQEGTDHVAIVYSLLTGTDLFTINSLTGEIRTKSTALDRETQDKHLVTIQIKDMKGASHGLATTGTATIHLKDINDNPPTFKQSSFTATVQENTMEKLILRIPVDDKDLVNTDNWFSKFVITKGNENGNFRIDTDPKTNEGLLYVVKPLDYEKTPNVKLEVSARNKAELQGTTAQWNTVVVDLAVTDVDEGPEFNPPIKYLTVKENTPNGTVIGTYTALDPETKSSAGILYYKVSDPASWINIDRGSGDLKVANTIDRESSFVQNGIYNVTVRAVDATSKTGTGTVVIQVEDVNDNIPLLPTEELVLCEKEGELGSLVLVAEDKDQSPYGAPFTFSIPEDSEGKWSITPLNDTAATLQQMKELHTGVHEVDVKVMDLQSHGKVQTVTVRICRCVSGICPAQQTSVKLGGLAVLTMLLPFLLLLLLGLLLALLCGTKHQKVQLDDVTDSGGVLLKSNTEAPGEEVDSSLLNAPIIAVDSGVKSSAVDASWIGNKSSGSMHENGMYKGNVITTTDTQYYDDHYGLQYGDTHLVGSGLGSGMGSGMGTCIDTRHLVQDSSLIHTWATNGRYLDQKLFYMGVEDDGRFADDVIHSYGYEGVGSAAGSVGSCSNLGEENLDFLDKLGPKFKTLADVCSKR